MIRRLPLLLSLLACLMAGAALLAPRQPGEARAAPALQPEPPDSSVALARIELLLPHLARGQPFPRPHAVALALAAGNAEIRAVLAGLSPDGAPTARQLAEAFGMAADTALLVEMGLGADAGWMARLMATTIRLGAQFAGHSPALAAIGAARRDLEEGDLPGMDSALAVLEGATAEAMAPFREALRRRIAQDEAAARLTGLALRQPEARR